MFKLSRRVLSCTNICQKSYSLKVKQSGLASVSSPRSRTLTKPPQTQVFLSKKLRKVHLNFGQLTDSSQKYKLTLSCCLPPRTLRTFFYHSVILRSLFPIEFIYQSLKLDVLDDVTLTAHSTYTGSCTFKVKAHQLNEYLFPVSGKSEQWIYFPWRFRTFSLKKKKKMFGVNFFVWASYQRVLFLK